MISGGYGMSTCVKWMPVLINFLYA